ncbi:hypothetical protein ACLOJK_037053 [Asimina triloba]
MLWPDAYGEGLLAVCSLMEADWCRIVGCEGAGAEDGLLARRMHCCRTASVREGAAMVDADYGRRVDLRWGRWVGFEWATLWTNLLGVVGCLSSPVLEVTMGGGRRLLDWGR